MQARTLEVLDYKKILERLAKMARSGLVKEKILNLRPSSDFAYLTEEIDKMAAMAKVIARHGNIDLFGLYDFKDIIGYVRRGGVLEPGDLLKEIGRAHV